MQQKQPVGSKPAEADVKFDIKHMGIFYLLLATVDLPFLLCRQGEHGFPVFLCKVQLILQSGKEIAERVKKCW